MPSLSEHYKHSFKRYGVEGKAIHKWLDEPALLYHGSNHHHFRHDLDTIDIAKFIFRQHYADKIIENIVLDHFYLDKIEEKKPKKGQPTTSSIIKHDIRLSIIINELSKGKTIVEIAKLFHCNRRTIARDLKKYREKTQDYLLLESVPHV